MIEIHTVGYADELSESQARQLAEQLHFTVDRDADSCLFVSQHKVSLKFPQFSELYVDFSADAWSKRKSEGKKQGLVRACKPAKGLKIIDATAGWGRDGAVLASFGAEVLLIERNPVMALLLKDALARQSANDKKQVPLSLHAGDAKSYLKALDVKNYPDIVYIDPMHPERNKSALVKKDLQVLQQMIGPDEDALELLQVARTRVKQRVVVKWPQKAPPLTSPDMTVSGKTVRFDVYFSATSV